METVDVGAVAEAVCEADVLGGAAGGVGWWGCGRVGAGGVAGCVVRLGEGGVWVVGVRGVEALRFVVRGGEDGEERGGGKEEKEED